MYIRYDIKHNNSVNEGNGSVGVEAEMVLDSEETKSKYWDYIKEYHNGVNNRGRAYPDSAMAPEEAL